VLAPVSLAHAEPTASEIAAARSLFEQGVALEKLGDWPGALEKFRRVVAVVESPKVRFHLARCLESTGQLVDALNEYSQVSRLPAASRDDDEVLAQSNARRAALDKRIPRVIIDVKEAPASEVRIDGGTISPAVLGTELPLNPGAHRIVARTSDGRTFEESVELVEGAPPHLVAVKLAPAPSAAAPSPAQAAAAPPERSRNIGPYVLGGAGVALVGAGATFYALRASTLDELDRLCGPARDCPESARDSVDRGSTQTTLGNVLVVSGAAAVGGALVWWAVAPRTGAAGGPTSVVRSAAVSASPAGVVVRGSF
jgi:hypothetical protein